MAKIRVVAGGGSNGILFVGDHQFPCALGKGGVLPAVEKREGDGATPLGSWPLRRVLWRADRGSKPETALPLEEIKLHDGWCDAPDDLAYNRPVTLPYPASAETLWRDDALYDLIVVLGHNDDPVVPGSGSAIFWHIAKPDFRPTEGCVAITKADLYTALTFCGPGSVLTIQEA